MTSIVTPGDAAKIGGRPMTGVDGPRGCDRSTTTSRPDCKSSTSCASDMFQVPLELKSVLEQRQIADVRRRSHRVDLCDDRRQLAGGERFVDRGDEAADIADRGGPTNSGSGGD